ncbi:ComEA family DNA-binding protein [Pseudomonas thivervalensis]|uniref:ComEA family DNA-binding protein n=1 Tax=Pseudomonas thivervalensis TaxID=86265 RepID=UPI003D658DBD
MRTRYFYSLVFALLTGASIATVAAPAAKLETVASQQAIEVGASQRVKIDLNGADAATLQRELLGVGEAKAKAIVAYRESIGAFSSVEELLEVKGIGKAIVDRNRDKLEVR